MEIIILVVACIASFIAGYFTGKYHRTYTGSVVLRKNEDGDDRIVFNLGMEYDDIAKYSELIFKVIK